MIAIVVTKRINETAISSNQRSLYLTDVFLELVIIWVINSAKHGSHI
jgi:hypothetical protein